MENPIENKETAVSTKPELGLLVKDPQKGDMRDQLTQLKEAGKLKTKPEEEKAVQRGGRRTKAKRSILGPAVQKTQSEKDSEKHLLNEARVHLEKDEKRFKKEAQEMIEARSVFTEDIKLLKKSLSGASGTQEKRLKALLSQAEDHLRIIDEINPHREVSEGREAFAFRDIVEKFKQYEKARRAQAHAEIKVNEGVEKYQGEYARAQAEAVSLNMEISSLIKEGEIIIANKEPRPRDEGIYYPRTDAVKDKEKWGRAHNVAPEKEVESLGVTNPEETNMHLEQPQDISIGEQEKTEKVEHIPLEFTTEEVTPHDSGHATRVEARSAEVSSRIAELEGKTDTSSTEELSELKNESDSLAKEMGRIEKNKPLRSAYDEAMDRIWKENEAKKLAPISTEVKNEDISVDETPLATPREGQGEGFAKFENLAEGTLANIAILNNRAEALAEETGLGEKVLKVAERFNTLKKEHKYAYSAALILAGLGSMATGTALAGGAIATSTALLRALSGVGVFYSKDKQYAREAKEEGRDRSQTEVGGDRLKAIAWGVLMGGLLGHVLGESFHTIKDSLADLSAENSTLNIAKGEIPKMTEVIETSAQEEIAKLKAEALAEALPPQEAPIPEQTLPAEAPILESTAPENTIPPEIIPGNTAELAQIEKVADGLLANDMDKLFGGPKFAWFGHVNGLDSINWKDPEVGFGSKSVAEILSAKPASMPMDGGPKFGIENYQATTKIQDYITNVTNVSGITPNANEKVADFIRHAALAKLSK